MIRSSHQKIIAKRFLASADAEPYPIAGCNLDNGGQEIDYCIEENEGIAPVLAS